MSYTEPHAHAAPTLGRVHRRRFTVLVGALIALFTLALFSGARAQDAYDGPVTELAIRSVTAPLDVFTSAREAFLTALVEQPGVTVDREFVAILDGTTFQAPETPVYVGMTQYATPAAFAAAGQALGSSPEAATFFGSFSPLAFTALRPLDATDAYDLATLADRPGQLLEIAVRDLSTYADFDAGDYDALRLTFLSELTSRPGVVAEYQWVSVLDPNLVVGMTVYESAEAFEAVVGDETLLAAAMPFLESYPTVTGMIVVDAR
jgi:hypothetical protein